MKSLDRRTFLKTSALATAAVSLSPRSWSQVRGANDEIRAAVVGFNRRGRALIQDILNVPGVRLAALCDVDQAVLDRESSRLRARGIQVETYTDVRKLLENSSIDTITTATPNHWHALISIWSMQAGKDVYVEKPVSHNVSEGRRIVEMARKHKKIVQTGTGGRSNPATAEAVRWVREGNLGKVQISRGLCYKRRDSIGKVAGPQPVPDTVNYDLWTGPAEMQPLMRQSLHYDWHWDWNTGNGDLGNQGIHQMDVARWFLGESTVSPRVLSMGGRLGYIDDGQTPNTQIVCHDYGSSALIFEVRGLPAKEGSEEMDRFLGISVGNVVHCENGYITVGGGSVTAYDRNGKVIRKFEGGDRQSHAANFFAAVRSRRHTDLTADILEGHLSSALCHTGNLSHILGTKAAPGEIRERIQGDKRAAESYGRMLEHLAATGVSLKKESLVLGESLRMDPQTERFIDNRKADALLTRQYRAGFVIPEKV